MPDFKCWRRGIFFCHLKEDIIVKREYFIKKNFREKVSSSRSSSVIIKNKERKRYFVGAGTFYSSVIEVPKLSMFRSGSCRERIPSFDLCWMCFSSSRLEWFIGLFASILMLWALPTAAGTHTREDPPELLLPLLPISQKTAFPFSSQYSLTVSMGKLLLAASLLPSDEEGNLNATDPCCHPMCCLAFCCLTETDHAPSQPIRHAASAQDGEGVDDRRKRRAHSTILWTSCR